MVIIRERNCDRADSGDALSDKAGFSREQVERGRGLVEDKRPDGKSQLHRSAAAEIRRGIGLV